MNNENEVKTTNRSIEEKIAYIADSLKAPVIILFVLITMAFVDLKPSVTNILSVIAGNVVEKATNSKKEDENKKGGKDNGETN